MARKRKMKSSDSGGGSPGWMTTFSDLMSLLLTFFILLFSMSSVSDSKFNDASASIISAFSGSQGGLLPGGGNDPSKGNTSQEGVEGTGENGEEIPEELVEMYKQMQKELKEQGMEGNIGIEIDSEGIYLDIKDSILFSSGSAEIVGSGKETLDNLAELINQVGNEVIVEGYTDDVPMSNEQYASNWELSTSRAVSVLRYLSEEKKVAPTRLSARGYGEHHPIVPNDSAKNRAENRRVNIVILYEEFKEES